MTSNSIKRILFTLVAAIMLLMPALALADDTGMNPADIPPASDTTVSPYSFMEWSTSGGTRATLAGSCSVSKISTNSVMIEATSSCVPSSFVTATAYLQWYRNGAWTDYSSTASVYRSTTGNTITATKTITVARGYYYRTRGVHTMTGKSLTTVCSSLKID